MKNALTEEWRWITSLQNIPSGVDRGTKQVKAEHVAAKIGKAHRAQLFDQHR